jgi:hypothetical protein
VTNLHKAFDLIFRFNGAENLDELLKIYKKQPKQLTRVNEINVDLHITSQMILLYPDIDAENSLKQMMLAFNKMMMKLCNYFIHF